MIVRRLLAISLLGLVLLACPPTPTSLPAPTGTPAPATAAVVEPSISATVTPVISRATPTSTPVLPSPTPTPKPAPTIFQKVLAPFVELAKLRRDQNEEYQRCADKELNQGRLNLLLLGYGETFEPRPEKPDPAPIIIGSLRYLSLDLASNTVAEISLTHDIRCPECEIALAVKQKIKRQEAGLFRLDQAYLSPAVGSFSLLGKTLCNATGLWPDFQIAFHDTFLRDLVDGPLEGVLVDVPDNISVQPFYLGGKKYDRPDLRYFPKGWQSFDGLKALAYIKTVPVPPAGQLTYPQTWEHQVRADGFFSALKKKAESRISDGIFWLKFSLVVTQHSLNQSLALDFDTFFLLRNLDTVAGEIKSAARDGMIAEPGLPSITLEQYIVDKSSSLDQKMAAVRWVDRKVLDDYWMQNDFQTGVYAANITGLEVPYNANPYSANLIADYWGSVRRTVKKALLPDWKENLQITPD